MTLLGLIISIGAVVVGNILEGGTLSFLFQPSALIIVLGGTIGATMTQSCPKVFFHAIRMVATTLFRKNISCKVSLPDIWDWNLTMRSGNQQRIQQLIDAQRDPFIIKTLQLLRTQSDHHKVRDILDVELEQSHEDGMHAVQVFESMGGYSPTIGIIGAILGLIQVMNNIADPEALGTGIAVAFVATIYGVGFANLIYLPLAEKLKALVIFRSRYHEMIAAGATSIVQGDNINVINNRLESYMCHHQEGLSISHPPTPE